ncbi:MAG: S9 family peptidase [Planctomycetes bacterium]|nr:S9 family peptidase [Planctomycetota bacterium]
MKPHLRTLSTSLLAACLCACAATETNSELDLARLDSSTGADSPAQGQPTYLLSGGTKPADASGKRAMAIADYYKCATPSAPALSPDGSRVAFALRHYEFEAGKTWSELWMMKADGSDLRQMTSGRNTDTEPQFTPDGKRICFMSTRSGEAQVWTIPVDGGEPTKLTSFYGGLGGPVWSPDGKWIACSADIFPEYGIDEAAQKRVGEGLEKGKLKVHVADDLYYRHWTSWADGRRTHILLVDAANGAVVKDLTPGNFESPIFMLGGGRGYDFSPDSKELCYVSNHDADEACSTNADLWTVAVDGAIKETSARNLTAKNKGWDGSPLYSPDGKYIGFISQETPGYESDLKRLALLDRKSGAVTYLTDRESFDNWVDDFRWTKDGSALVFEAELHGRTPLYRIPVAGGTPIEQLVHSYIAGWELTPDGQGVVYGRRSIGEPGEIFSAKLAPARGVAASGADKRRLTQINAQIESQVDFRPAQEYWFEGDGQKVHCFLVTPHDFDPTKKYPLILNVHGGPQSQWADSFRGDWQVYPAAGYVVAFCNPTGSTGYGQKLTDGIARDWGGRVYRDLMNVTDQLEKLPFVDAQRVGLMGWSYGGYMTMWMQGHTDRFKCIASMMGVYDLKAEYGATEELWFPEHDFGGTPWESGDYDKWSPSNFVKNFKTPALVVTGELDYRVPYTLSLEYYTALRKMKVPARLVVLPNAGHWPAWHEMAFYYDAHLDFFHTYLGGEPAPYDVKQYSRNLQFSKEPPAKP